MTLKHLKERLLSNKQFREGYETKDEIELAIRVGGRVQELRLYFGWTQAQLAEKMETKQPNIARIEAGKKLPTLSTLHKAAQAAGTYLIEPNFACLTENKIQDFSIVSTQVELYRCFNATESTVSFELVEPSNSRLLAVYE
jgi:transcriptional regulator with XRE-family HTH domain